MSLLMDRGFTTVAILLWAASVGLGITGTMKWQSAGIPRDQLRLKSHKKGKGLVQDMRGAAAWAYSKAKKIMITSTFDRNEAPILVGTNEFGLEGAAEFVKKTISSCLAVFSCPPAFLKYNERKFVVDKSSWTF